MVKSLSGVVGGEGKSRMGGRKDNEEVCSRYSHAVAAAFGHGVSCFATYSA